MNKILNLMPKRETDSATQAQQLAELIRSEGGSMKRDEMLDRAEFIPSESRLDNVLGNMVGREELKRDESVDGLYLLPEKVQNKTVSESTQKEHSSTQADQSTAMSSNGQEQLPLLNEQDLTSVPKGEDPLPEGVDKHLAVDKRLVETVEESRKQAIARVPGNSISSIPSITSSEARVVVEIEEGCKVVQGGLYVWVNDKGGVIIMWAHWVDGQTVRLIPESDDHSVIELQGDRDEWAWTCIARVTQVLIGV